MTTGHDYIELMVNGIKSLIIRVTLASAVFTKRLILSTAGCFLRPLPTCLKTTKKKAFIFKICRQKSEELMSNRRSAHFILDSEWLPVLSVEWDSGSKRV